MGHNASLPEHVFFAPIIQRTTANDHHVEDTTKVQQQYCPDKCPKHYKLRHSVRLPSGVDTSGDVKNTTMPKKHASHRRDFDPRPSGDEKTHHRCKKVSEKDDEAIFKQNLQQAHTNHVREKKETQDAYLVPTRDTPYHHHKQIPRGSFVVQHASDGCNVYKCDEKKVKKECFSIPFMKQEEQMREEATKKAMRRKSRKGTVNIEGVEYEKKRSHHHLMKELLKPECSSSYTDALARYSRVETERKNVQNSDTERKNTHFENTIISQCATEKRYGLRIGLERRKDEVSDKKSAKRGGKSDTVARYASLVELERKRDARETYADVNDPSFGKKTTVPVYTTVQYSPRDEREKRHSNVKKNEAPMVNDASSKATVEVIYPSKVESERRRDLQKSYADTKKSPFVNDAESSVLEIRYPSKVESERRRDVPCRDINQSSFVIDDESSVIEVRNPSRVESERRRDVPSREINQSSFVNDAESSVLEIRYPSRVELERRRAASNEETFLKRAVMQSDSVAEYASLVALERRRDTGDCCSDLIVNIAADDVNKVETNFTYSNERVSRGKENRQEKEARSGVKLNKSFSREIVAEKTKESKVNANVELYESKSRSNPSSSDSRTISHSNEPLSSTIIVTPNEYETKRTFIPNTSILGRPSSRTWINDLDTKKIASCPNSVPNLKFPSNTKSNLCRNKVTSAQGLFNSNPIVMTCQVDVKGQRYATLNGMGISKVVPPSRVWRCSAQSFPTPQPQSTCHESGHPGQEDDDEEYEPYIDELCSKSVRSKNKMFETLAGKTKPRVQTRLYGYPLMQAAVQEPVVECHHRMKHQQQQQQLQQLCIKKRPACAAPPVFTPWDRGMIPHSRPRIIVEDPPERRIHEPKPAPKKVDVDEDFQWQSRPDNKLDPERVTRFEKAFRSTMRWRAVAACDNNKHQGAACTLCGEKRGKKNGCSMCSPHEQKLQKRVLVDSKVDKVQNDENRVRTKFFCKPASHFYQPILEEGQFNSPMRREPKWGSYERERRQERVCRGATGREKQCECRGRETKKYEPEDSDYEIDFTDSASNYDPYFKDSQKALYRNARAGWNERDQMVAARQECLRRPRGGKRPVLVCRRMAGSEVSFQSRNRGKATRKPLRGILKRCGCRYGDRCGGD